MKEFIIISDEVEVGVFRTSLPLEEEHIFNMFSGLNDLLVIEIISKEEKERRKKELFERV